MSDEKQKGGQQHENSNRPAAAARPPSTPSVRVTNQYLRPSPPPPPPRRATTQTKDSDCIARQTSIRFRHSDVDSFGDGSLSGGEASDSCDTNGGPPPIAGMEVMDLRPTPSGVGVEQHAHDRALNHMETCSLVSNNSSHNSSHNNSQVGNSSANGGGDQSSQASGNSGRVPNQPNHWHEAGSLFPPEVNKNNMSNLGRRKSALDSVVVEGKFLLGESEQAYRSLQRLLNSDDHKKININNNNTNINTKNNRCQSLNSFNSIHSNNSNNTGFNSAPLPHSSYDRDSGSESSTGSSKLWDAMESSHASHNSMMSLYSTMTEESDLLTLERRRQERRNMYVRRCAKAMAGFVALAMLSMSAIYLIDGEDHHLNHNEASSVLEELLSFGSGRLHPHGRKDDDRMLLDAVPPSYPWVPPDFDDDEEEEDDQATWSSPGQEERNDQAWSLPGKQEEGNDQLLSFGSGRLHPHGHKDDDRMFDQAWSLPGRQEEENDQTWSLPGKQEEEFYRAWPSLGKQQEENDQAWSHSLPGKREVDEGGFRYYTNDPVEVITPQERTRREREARERTREERLKEQEQRVLEREQKRHGLSQLTITPQDRTLGGREERMVPLSQEHQQDAPRLTLNQLREERMRTREVRLREQEQRLPGGEQNRDGQLTTTPQHERPRTAREEPLQEHERRRGQATIPLQDRTAPRAREKRVLLAQEQRAQMTEEEQLDYFINMDVGAQYDVVERITPQEQTRQARVERELVREHHNDRLGMTPQELTRRAREERELTREQRDQLGITPQEITRRAREKRVLAQQQQVQMQYKERVRREELAVLR